MNLNAKKANELVKQLLQLQAEGTDVEYVIINSRLNMAGFADDTGLVSPKNIMFFAGRVGESGAQGFARELTLADTPFKSGSGEMPSGQQFVGLKQGILISPYMPPWMRRAILHHTALFQETGTKTREFGTTKTWPCGGIGDHLKTAASNVAGERLVTATNGSQGLRALQADTLIILPPKKSIQIGLRVYRPFYATTKGGPVNAASGNKLIDNTGKLPTQANEFTYEHEECAYVDYLLEGFRHIRAH